MSKKDVLPIVLSILIALSAGFIGSYFTASSVSTWYTTINKPSFSPPNWIFAPVWTALYILMGVAAFLIWRERHHPQAKTALIFYGVQLVLNAFWSIIFFGMSNPGLALIELLVLWVLVLITMVKFYKINRTAGWLLAPYLLWGTFASILNYAIWMLN